LICECSAASFPPLVHLLGLLILFYEVGLSARLASHNIFSLLLAHNSPTSDRLSIHCPHLAIMLRIAVFLLFSLLPISPFAFLPQLRTSLTPLTNRLLSDPDSTDPGAFESTGAYAKALQDLAEAEQAAAMATRSSGVSEAEQALFDSRTDEVSAMRARIAERAKELGVEKSANTAEVFTMALEEKGGDALRTSSDLDISQFATKPEDFKGSNPFDTLFGKDKKDERELSEDEMIAADPLGQLSIFDACLAEIKSIEWPKPKTVISQTLVTAVSLVATVFFIITLDKNIQALYETIGLIPKTPL